MDTLKTLLLSFTVLLCSASQALASQALVSQAKNRVQLSAPQTKIKTGSEFYLDLLAVDVAPVYGVQLAVQYDPTQVLLIDSDSNKSGAQIEHGDFFNRQHFFTLSNKADSNTGTIQYTVSQVNPAKSVGGDGRLVRLLFKSKGVDGQTAVTMTQAKFGTLDGKTIDSQTKSTVQLHFAQQHSVPASPPWTLMHWATLLMLSALVLFCLLAARWLSGNKKRILGACFLFPRSGAMDGDRASDKDSFTVS